MNIEQLLEVALDKKASDLHLSSGLPPAIRVDGELQYLDQEAITNDTLRQMLNGIISAEQSKALDQEWEIDLAYSLQDKARFRVNIFQQARGIAAAFRPIPTKIPTLAALGLPKKFESFCDFNNGLVLVTGPTGSGKSTTLAAMINYINHTQHQHIITVEDPIEFTHIPVQCLINQREVTRDTKNFNAALRSALREDPDVILIGEMRDLETIRLALTAAETGHLVFGTLHTNSAAKTIDRIIDVFPAGEKDMIRAMLSESLRVVISQTLIKRKGGGRIAAQEIMICTPAIRNLIRENKIPQIYTVMQTGQALGMHTHEQHIKELTEKNLI